MSSSETVGVPTRPRKFYIRPKPRRGAQGARAVTIALGFQCHDGIVLCADRQITVPGYYKYQEEKIRTLGEGHGWVVASVYSGSPDLMNLLYDKVSRRLAHPDFVSAPEFQVGKKRTLEVAFVRKVLEESLSEIGRAYKKPVELETLCALSLLDELILLKTVGRLVVDANTAEYLGVGDSSLIRYLDSLLNIDSMDATQALQVGVGMVEKANQHIDGCSGGPDSVLVRRWGHLTPP